MASWCYMRSNNSNNNKNVASTKELLNYKDLLVFPGKNSEDLA